MAESKCAIGMIGLGVMGRNLVLNMADHGFAVAGYDKDAGKVQALRQEGQGRNVRAAENLDECLAMLGSPRVIMMLVPAGAAVDAVIGELLPRLKPGDVIVDGGNSHFTDTDRRGKMLAGKDIRLLGMGVSGGEHGARHGPSLMPGGSKDAYERVRPILEAVAARAAGEPCVVYLGRGSAGHYVKMVHNGIEYGVMQLIAETYDLMKRGLGLTNGEMHDVYDRWNGAELQSYLIEITSHIFSRVDEKTGRCLVDVILDEAKQKGTGMWTSQSAMDLQVPIPTIDAAVSVRDLSVCENERVAASHVLKGPFRTFEGNGASFLDQLRNALYVGMIATYAQGLALLGAASRAYGYALNLEDVARIWRGGCIIRAALLERIRDAYRSEPSLVNLLVDRHLAQEVIIRQEDLRAVVCRAAELGLPAPAMMASLAYFDGYRSAWLPANLIQAQRDFFGAHTYERIDEKGVFHTQWTTD